MYEDIIADLERITNKLEAIEAGDVMEDLDNIESIIYGDIEESV